MEQVHGITPHIFREYDIRGVVDKDLTEEAVCQIGKAFGTIVKGQGGSVITSGRDGRLHSKRLQEALIAGLVSTGIKVIDIGQCPTPVLYFSIFHLDTDGGIQITGSHNPPQFNGLKMCLGPSTIHGQQIQEIKRLIENGEFEQGNGLCEKHEIIGDYLKYLSENININRPLKVVLDCGNGVSALVAPDAFRQAGCIVESLFCQVDGTFPNHHPDPTVLENLKDLKKRVKDTGADIGIAFDGDGDRIGVVDENANVIYGDKILLLLARRLLRDNPGAAIIGEVKCSHILYEDIKAHGGRPIMWKTGHSLIKQKMKDSGALLAGEMSGHIFFADRFFGFDDATYAALRLCELLAEENKSLSMLLHGLAETVSTPEIRMDCSEEHKFVLVDKVKESLKADGYDVIDVDGARVVFDDGWGLIRASNTQPVIVLRFEANTPDRLKEIRNLIEGRLEEVKKALG